MTRLGLALVQALPELTATYFMAIISASPSTCAKRSSDVGESQVGAIERRAVNGNAVELRVQAVVKSFVAVVAAVRFPAAFRRCTIRSLLQNRRCRHVERAAAEAGFLPAAVELRRESYRRRMSSHVEAPIPLGP